MVAQLCDKHAANYDCGCLKWLATIVASGVSHRPPALWSIAPCWPLQLHSNQCFNCQLWDWCR